MINLFTQYDSTSRFISYVHDVKPYHTKILNVEVAYRHVDKLNVSIKDTLHTILVDNIDRYDGNTTAPVSPTTVAATFSDTITFADGITQLDIINVNISESIKLTDKVKLNENVYTTINETNNYQINITINQYDNLCLHGYGVPKFGKYYGYDDYPNDSWCDGGFNSHDLEQYGYDNEGADKPSITTLSTNIQESIKFSEVIRFRDSIDVQIKATPVNNSPGSYTHIQEQPVNEIVIVHNLYVYPIVRVYTPDDDEMQPYRILYDDINTVRVLFIAPFTGTIRMF